MERHKKEIKMLKMKHEEETREMEKAQEVKVKNIHLYLAFRKTKHPQILANKFSFHLHNMF